MGKIMPDKQAVLCTNWRSILWCKVTQFLGAAFWALNFLPAMPVFYKNSSQVTIVYQDIQMLNSFIKASKLLGHKIYTDLGLNLKLWRPTDENWQIETSLVLKALLKPNTGVCVEFILKLNIKILETGCIWITSKWRKWKQNIWNKINP